MPMTKKQNKTIFFYHTWQYCLLYFFVYSNFCRHPTTLESDEVSWGLMKDQNKLEGINPVINIIAHNWLNDHQGNAYIWLDWLHRCHLIIKRWKLVLVNVLRRFSFEHSEFSVMKGLVCFLFELAIWSLTASFITD